ncbi:hypothetical protein ANANG_G00070780 [Anguilla anguilla]|uniref:Uncharacterized protein n=1 Tax=Anguilla anguilla TaxID=7936 RepID=A0A9D3MR13_ANGAN|nr:hypothetical protein ANANG_G00070780 [Anguilla anguilla]
MSGGGRPEAGQAAEALDKGGRGRRGRPRGPPPGEAEPQRHHQRAAQQEPEEVAGAVPVHRQLLQRQRTVAERRGGARLAPARLCGRPGRAR